MFYADLDWVCLAMVRLVVEHEHVGSRELVPGDMLEDISRAKIVHV